MNALTLTEMKELAVLFAKSGMFPEVREMAQAFVRIKAGEELGIGPFTAMSELFIVKGKVVMSANLQAAKCKESGKYDYQVLQLDDEGCEILFRELWLGVEGASEWRDLGKSFFGPKEAQKAGLAGGDNYRKYDRNMYFARAMSNGVAWYCPDVTIARTYTPGELPGSERATGAPDAPQANVERLVGMATEADPADEPALLPPRDVRNHPLLIAALERQEREEKTFAEKLDKKHAALVNDIPASSLKGKKGTPPEEIAKRLNAAIAERDKANPVLAKRADDNMPPRVGWDADGLPVHPEELMPSAAVVGVDEADEPMKLTSKGSDRLTYVDRVLMQIGRIVPKAAFSNGVRRGHVCDVVFEAFQYQPKPEDLDRLMETLKGFSRDRITKGLMKLEKMEPKT